MRAAALAVCCSALVTLSTLNGAPAVASTTSPGAQASPAPAAALTEAGALQAAAASGGRVEILEARGRYEETFANPDGSLTRVQHGVLQRIPQGSGWQTVDTTLVVAEDGSIAPVASGVDVTFSGGGDDSLVQLDQGAVQLGLEWIDELPTPTLDGNRATYPEVLPGVDLQVQVHPESFTQVLVVESAEAAANPQLAELSLDLELSAGAELTAGSDGSLALTSPGGEVVLSAPAPVMWDSSGTDVADRVGADEEAHAPGEGDSVATIDTEIAPDAVVLQPDQELLQSPETTYPVFIDPTFAAGQAMRVMVNQAFPTTSYTNWGDPDQGVGYIVSGGTQRKRLYWSWDTTPYLGSQILGATFSAVQTHSYSCTPSTVNLYTSWGFGAGHTWNNQPPLIQHISSATTAIGRAGCTPGGAWVEFNATLVAQQIVQNGWTSVGLALLAANENDQNSWKRFRYDAVFSVTYNRPPTQPSQLHTNSPVTACVTGDGRPFIGDNSPILQATSYDPDSNVRIFFDMWHTGGGQLDSVGTGYQGSGTWFGRAIDPLPDATYSWRTVASDGLANSPYSGFCEFTVDTIRPSVPPLVVSNDGNYVAGGPASGGVGITANFKATANGVVDVNRYAFSLNSDAPGVFHNAASLGGEMNFQLPITTSGPQRLYVWSMDRAGNQSDPTVYNFNVLGAPLAAQWKLDSLSASTSPNAVTGASALTVEGATLGQGHFFAQDTTDRALTFDGTDDVASSTVSTSTADNFSIALWVKPSTQSGSRVAFSADGGTQSAFTIGRDNGAGRWSFSRAHYDQTTTSWTQALSSTGSAGVNTWTHLVGVYNAAADTLTLYVNGSKVSEVSAPTGFAATGLWRVGRAGGPCDPVCGSDQWAGTIDDVRVIAGAIDQAAVRQIYAEPRA